MADLRVCPAAELPPGEMRLVRNGDLVIGVYNLGGRLCAIEDRCSHDDGPLAEGEFDPEEGVVICPRHGSKFEICSGRPTTLPAYLPVDTFAVKVDDGVVFVEIP